jgi:hypothetical protein
MEASPDRGSNYVCSRVSQLCDAIGACAAGYWRLDAEEDRLVQVVFVPGEGLDPQVSREFADATASVPLSRMSLGIVIAATTGRPAVSRIADLPADSGSGRWLRAFGAGRSVAVPVQDAQGAIRGVISVALPSRNTADDQTIVQLLGQIDLG